MKTVLVTGATRGLGLQICRLLVKEGYRIVAVGRKCSPDLERLMTINEKGELFFESADLLSVNLHALTRSITKKHGQLYGLINNAAIGHDGVLGTMHESQILELISMNIRVPILLSKYAARSMLLNGEGRIINVSSIIATTGFSGLSVYAASKAALIGFTKSLSRELGKANITVNALLPGYMQTDMTAALDKSKLEKIKRRSPMKKLVRPIDVAFAARYLLSPEAAMVTGTTLTIDGGSSA